MKKKLKDITNQEIEYVCKHNFKHDCSICPLKINSFIGCYSRMLDMKDILNNKVLNTEITMPEPPKESLLNKKDHDYLRAIIIDYIDDIHEIEKGAFSQGEHYIYVWVYGRHIAACIPIQEGTFEKMDPNEKYQVQELELDKEWEE